MSNPLLGRDALPTDVLIGGRAFPIRHDWRDGVRFELMVTNPSIPEEAKLALALGIWFDETPDADMGDVIETMLTFYRCGMPMTDVESSERLFSYDHDHSLLFGAFLTQYGVNLYAQECDLHWWQFRGMMSSLSDESQFIKVVGYRATKPSKGMSPEYRSFLMKMKRLHALPAADGLDAKKIRTMDDFEEARRAVRRAKGFPEEVQR